MAGAEFRVTNATGGVIGVFSTDASGSVSFEVPTLGAYYIDEVKPPKGYVVDTIDHKDVVVVADQETIVTFFDKKEAKLKITKTSSCDNSFLAGATIRVALDGGHESFDVVTGADGTAELNGLKEGTYTVSEIIAPSGYVLDKTPHPIKLVSGQLATISLANAKKDSLIIEKYDEKTGEKLDGAEFSLAKKGGSVLWQGMVTNGTHTFDNLDEGWYTVAEIAPPWGYLATTPYKDIYVENCKTVQLKFDNRPAPVLEIMKIDETTKLPLAGAKFRITETESKTVSEYVTGADGKITIPNLLEKIYSIEEIVAPDGYISETQHKDIQLEWGKTKTVIFTNKKRPVLEIKKLDSITNLPLAGAKFRVTKTQDKTVSEYTTDATGVITINKLDESVYTIDEISAPEGYLIDGENHKEIALEWGKTKSVIFNDTRKPTLIITKTVLRHFVWN